jgi:ribosomal protein S18 acetylase RimI-like enzyme
MEPIIRDYTQADKNSCIEAFKSNIPVHFAQEEIADFEQFLMRIEGADHRTLFYVVVYDDKVVGCGGFGDKDNIISLAWGLLHKDYHKKGFGEKLLLYRLEQIKKLYPGFPLVLDTSQHVYGFFEKYGFRTTKITNDYYTIGMHRYDMVFER